MAKIGTAHIEIKPVLNEEALTAIGKLIEDAVAAGIQRGMQRQNTHTIYVGDPVPYPGTIPWWNQSISSSGTTVSWNAGEPIEKPTD